MCGILLRGVGNAKNGIVLRNCIRDGTRNNIHNKIPGYILFCFYWELLLRSVLCMFYPISRFLENEGVIFDVNKTKKYLGILLRTSFRMPLSPLHLLHCTERRIYQEMLLQCCRNQELRRDL